MRRFGRSIAEIVSAAERICFASRYRLADLTYRLGIATPKRTAAGRYWSYEPTNSHGTDAGLASLSALSTDAVVFDVGAHTGEYSVPLAVDTDRTIIAFEPNGRSEARLRRTVDRNGVEARVDVHGVGVGAVDEERPFYRSRFSKLSAFDRASAERWGARVDSVESVPIVRLDSLVGDDIPPPDAIKIDVEGRERSVLDGGAETIAVHRPIVVVEVHDATAKRALSTWFRTRAYAVDWRDGALICHPRSEIRS